MPFCRFLVIDILRRNFDRKYFSNARSLRHKVSFHFFSFPHVSHQTLSSGTIIDKAWAFANLLFECENKLSSYLLLRVIALFDFWQKLSLPFTCYVCALNWHYHCLLKLLRKLLFSRNWTTLRIFWIIVSFKLISGWKGAGWITVDSNGETNFWEDLSKKLRETRWICQFHEYTLTFMFHDSAAKFLLNKFCRIITNNNFAFQQLPQFFMEKKLGLNIHLQSWWYFNPSFYSSHLKNHLNLS